MAPDMTGDGLLADPRGRRMCWIAVDEQSLSRSGRSELWDAARNGEPHFMLTELRRVLNSTDLAELSSCTDAVTLLNLVARSVDSARYWQDPDELDRALGDANLIEALEPVADAIGAAPASVWWPEQLALDEQVLVDWREDGAPPPRLVGAPEVLREWKQEAMAPGKRHRRKWVGGPWWSTPSWAPTGEELERLGGKRPELSKSTRQITNLGAVELLLEEDSSGDVAGLCRPVRCLRTPRTFEIEGATQWLDLVDRYPLDVTGRRRVHWSSATGLDGRWLLPD